MKELFDFIVAQVKDPPVQVILSAFGCILLIYWVKTLYFPKSGDVADRNPRPVRIAALGMCGGAILTFVLIVLVRSHVLSGPWEWIPPVPSLASILLFYIVAKRTRRVPHE